MVANRVKWELVAEPQADEYDSEVTLRYARDAGYALNVPAAQKKIFSRTVGVLENRYWREYDPAPVNDPAIDEMENYIRMWPAAYSQCRRLLRTIYVSLDRRVPPGTWGSSSGPGPSGFGSICVTIYSPVGAAEGIVHEMAHHKLRALGVGLQTSTRLILNDPTELHPSPIRYDKLRPMCAVVHALYSYCYVLNLELQLVNAGCLPAEMQLGILRRGISRYVPKLEFGFAIIERHLQCDVEGKFFFAGFSNWGAALLSGSRELLRSFNVELRPFSHPLL